MTLVGRFPRSTSPLFFPRFRVRRPSLYQIQRPPFHFLKNHSYIDPQDSDQEHRDAAAHGDDHNQRTPARDQPRRSPSKPKTQHVPDLGPRQQQEHSADQQPQPQRRQRKRKHSIRRQPQHFFQRVLRF